MKNSGVVNEKCPQRKGTCGTGGIWTSGVRERKERQERQEETPPGVGVSEMASLRVDETNMRAYTVSEFKIEEEKCSALQRSEHSKHDEDTLRHENERKVVPTRRMLWWIRIDDGPNMRIAKDRRTLRAATMAARDI